MNGYVAIGLLATFIVWSGFMYYEGTSKEAALCKAADGQHDLAQANVIVAAENGIIATVGQQQTITQETDNAYQAKRTAIDNLYADAIGVRPAATATGDGLPAVSGATGRPHAAAARPFRTKVFGLSGQECDENTEQLYALQDWVRGQRAIKQP